MIRDASQFRRWGGERASAGRPTRMSSLNLAAGVLCSSRMNRTLLAGIALSALLFPKAQFAQAAQAANPGHVYVGLLDDARIELDNWKPGVAHQRLIRPAFEKVGSEWRTVTPSAVPHHMTWDVAYHGRNLGQVESQTGQESASWEGQNRKFFTFIQAILTPPAAVPSVGSPSNNDFAGQIKGGPGAVRRPLVVVSKPNVRDPDGWHHLNQLPQYVAAEVRTQFRYDFPRADRCKDEEVVEHDWEFPDSSLRLPIAYASNKNAFLVEISLDAGDCGYVDDPNDPQSNPWYFVSADGVARRIGSFMEFLDAGDYDNDGGSEVIFFLSQGENTDGFVLFSDHLQKNATLIWHYH